MKTRLSFFIVLLTFVLCAGLGAQDVPAQSAPAQQKSGGSPASPAAAAETAADAGSETSAETATSAGSEASAVPDSFRSITLGSGMDAVKELLVADSLFGYKGERDVSLLPGENRSLIETNGLAFIKRAWFQFLEDKLYIMTFSLDPEKVDYYSVYSHLVEKYGEPVSLDPGKAVWDDGRVTLSLERPLTVKYTDAETFRSLLESDATGKAKSDINRERFIDEF